MKHSGWLLVPAVLAPAPAFATQYLTVEQVQRTFFPAADHFVTRSAVLDPASARAIDAAHPASVANPVPAAWAAYREGELLGYLYVDAVLGKQLYFSYALGLAADGTVHNLEILEYRETHGYEVRNAAWRSQFNGHSAAAPPVFGTDIKNISGATLSSRHITEGVARLLAIHHALPAP